MPQRTNEFQELVSLIRKSLARDGDTVEDSAMVRVQGLETKREIDILHKTSDGFTTIKISVEAKDEGRKIDLTTLEQLCAKYRGEGRVCVDKFIVVSRNGFSEGAIEKARLLDVPLLTLDEAKEVDWSKFGPEHNALRRPAMMHFRMAPHFHEIKTVPPLPPALANDIIKAGKVRCPTCPEGRDHGHLGCYVRRVTLERRDPEALAWFKQLEDQCQKNPEGALLNLAFAQEDGTVVNYQGVDYPIREIHVTIHAMSGNCPVKHTPYQLTSSEGGDQLIHHLSADIGNTQFSLVMPDGLKSKRVTLKFDRKNPKERAEQRKKQRKAAKKRRKKD